MQQSSHQFSFLAGTSCVEVTTAWAQVKSSKPEPRVCPHCDQVVGISTASLQIHLKRCTLDHD